MINYNWKSELKTRLKNLPGEKAHLDMIPYRLLSSSFKKNREIAKQSAVMCLFFEDKNKLFGLLMERTIDGGKHSGQISFPGGKKDKTDIDIEYTALRETFEEIGISKDLIEVYGNLTEVYIPVSNFLVEPFLGVVNFNPLTIDLKLSKNEVKTVFSFSVDELMNPNNRKLQTIPNHDGVKLKNIPCFVLNGRIVWGATAIILNEIKQIFKSIL